MPAAMIGRMQAGVLGAAAVLLAALFVVTGGLSPGVQPVTVLDCTGTDCVPRNITERPVDCNEWYVGMPRERLECRWTSQGIRNVSMVTDPGNYVTAPITEQDYSVEVVTRGEDRSFDMAFLPGGSILITENPSNPQEPGRILLSRNGDRTVLEEIDVVADGAVGGLMGLAVHPAYPEKPYIYVTYTGAWDEQLGRALGRERYYTLSTVVRYTLRNATLGDRTVLLDEIQGSKHSAGARLAFGPAGNLYVTTGVGSVPPAAHNPHDLRGKILRITPNGTVPADNPYADRPVYRQVHGDRPQFNASKKIMERNPVYARGFKNPQGLAWHPDTNVLYATMHGKNRYDEINRVLPGRNYGYGLEKCSESYEEDWYTVPDRYSRTLTGPVWCAEEWTMAPSGAAFVDDPDSPWYGDLFVAGLRSRALFRFTVQDGTVTRSAVFWYGDDLNPAAVPRIRDVESRNGALYVLTAHGTVVRLSPVTR